MGMVKSELLVAFWPVPKHLGALKSSSEHNHFAYSLKKTQGEGLPAPSVVQNVGAITDYVLE